MPTSPSKFDQAISVVLRHEGGWVSDPSDLGGETNYGISTLIIEREKITNEFLGLPATLARTSGWLKNLKPEGAIKVYRLLFWDKYGYDRLNAVNVATKVFDCGVNCGPSRAHTMAQKAAIDCGNDTDVDGILGPKSLIAINLCVPREFMAAMRTRMQIYYSSIIEARPANAKFKNNWFRRAEWGV